MSAVFILAVLTWSFTLSVAAQDEPTPTLPPVVGGDHSSIQVHAEYKPITEIHGDLVVAECRIVETGKVFYTDYGLGYSAPQIIWEPGTYTVTATYQGETLVQRVEVESLKTTSVDFVFGRPSSLIQPPTLPLPIPNITPNQNQNQFSLGGLGLAIALLIGVALVVYIVKRRKK